MESCNIGFMARHLLFTLLALGLTLSLEAQPTSSQQSPAQPTPPTTVASIEPGEIVNSVYHNSTVGFRYTIPFGWVDRTEEMRETATDRAKAGVLLAIFQRPPEAQGDTVNAAVVIAVEAASAYPGLKSAAQYFGPVTELTTAKGFKPVADPYEFPVDGRPIVRRDFIRTRSAISMHQSTLALLTKGSIVSFTFLGGSDDAVTALIEQLAFGRARKPAHK
jgi:hypothetical protein